MINEIKEPSMKKTPAVPIKPLPLKSSKSKMKNNDDKNSEGTKKKGKGKKKSDNDNDDDDDDDDNNDNNDNNDDENNDEDNDDDDDDDDDENPYVSQIKRNAKLDYRGRYLVRPEDYLVICMAMMSQHSDLDEGMTNVSISIYIYI